MKNIFLTLDTETADLTGAVYDVGYTIADKKGSIIAERTFLVEEIFTDATRMMGAFYAGKLFTHYAYMLERGEIALTPWATIVETLRADIVEHGVTVICAYNAAFDFRVMASTHKMLGYTGSVLEGKLQTLDLWRFACETKLSQTTYHNLAVSQNWQSTAGNLKTGAEYAYRYCSGDWGFIEDHTALSDARIETAILAACMATKKRIPYGQIGGAPWRLAQPKKKEA